MNIFILSENHEENATWHVDRHVVKQITEGNQMLCTARRLLGDDSAPYEIAYPNHPITKWVRESQDNYIFTCNYVISLCKEYTFRYGKIHKGESIVQDCLNKTPDFEKKEMTPHIYAVSKMGNAIKFIKDNMNVTEIYKLYYCLDKSHLFSWKNRSVPFWI